MKHVTFFDVGKALMGLMMLFWGLGASAQNDPGGNNTNDAIVTATNFGGLPGTMGGYFDAGGWDIDYYAVTIPAGCGVATFKLTSTGTNYGYLLDAYSATSFNPLLVNQVAGPDSLTILCGGASTTTIYVKVTPYGLVGNYTLKGYFDVSDPCECNNTFGTAYPIALNGSFSAKLWGTNKLISDGTAYDQDADMDFYKVTTTQSGVLNVGIDVGTTGGVNPYQAFKMQIFDTLYTLLNDTYSSGNISTATTLSVGTYYIKIIAYDIYGNYTPALANDPFTITTSYDILGLPEYNNTFQTANIIPIDTSFIAKMWGENIIITNNTNYDSEQDQDFYQVTTTQPGVLNVGINLAAVGGINGN